MVLNLNWKELEGKRVHIILNNNYEYNGIINEVSDAGNGLIFIMIKDKFDKLIGFSVGEIKFIEEKKEDGKSRE